jgi:aspartyl-tRNA(Asn)/glutamyl-tRNA(Gln) amidotransferase subunit C
MPAPHVSITRTDVEHVARLARLALADEELDAIRSQLSKILEHAARVTSLETEGVPPTSHAIPLSNVARPDEPGPCLTQDEALALAPAAESGHFRVPRILENGGFGGVAAPEGTDQDPPEAANPPTIRRGE